MAIDFPSSKEVLDRVRTSLQNSLPNLNPFLRNSLIDAIITSLGLRIYDVYYQLEQNITPNFFPDTAINDFLERWGTYRNITRNPSTSASGSISATGTVATNIPATTQLQNSDGLVYEVQADVAIANVNFSISSLSQTAGTATAISATAHQLATGIDVTIAGANETDYNGTFEVIVIDSTTFTYAISPSAPATATGTITGDHDVATLEVLASDAGDNTNLLSGDSLTLTTPIAGVDSVAFVGYLGLTGGADEEIDDSLRDRILDSWQNPVAHFNVAEIETTAKTVAGVTRVWISEATPSPGNVTVYFVRDGDTPIIPDSSEISDVKNAILEIKPADIGDSNVIVSAPTPVTVSFSFSSINPDSTEMRTAIQNSLDQFFDEEVNVSQDIPQVAYESAIFNTIDSTGARVISFILLSPTGDVSISTGELGVLGTITF